MGLGPCLDWITNRLVVTLLYHLENSFGQCLLLPFFLEIQINPNRIYRKPANPQPFDVAEHDNITGI